MRPPTAGRAHPAPTGPARHGDRAPALKLRGVWVEPKGQPAILRGVDLSVARGRAGRADGPQRRGQVDAAARTSPACSSPTRGKIAADGRVALLLQNPNDYLVHERVGDEAPPDALAAVGLARLRRPPSARPLRRRAAAAGARDRAGRGGRRAAGAAVPRRADARDGPRAQGRPRRPARPPRGDRHGACSSPRTTPSSPPPSPTASCCWPTARRSPTAPRPRCCRAAGTSRPRRRASCAAPAAR